MPDSKGGKREEEKRKFAGEKVPSMKRRSQEHDYRSKRFYMITLVVDGRRPLLGRLVGNAGPNSSTADEPRVELTPLGQAVADEWWHISKYYNEVTVVGVQVMPDHLHGILYVREQTEFHLGQVIKGYKLGCNRILRAALETQRTKEGNRERNKEGNGERNGEGNGEGNGERNKDGNGERPDDAFGRSLLSYAANSSQPMGHETLWEPKYNDKILHNYSTLDKWKAYLQDNPRRLAIRRAFPDLFRVRFGISVAGQSYAAIGNLFLLNHPEKVQVKLSRSLSEEDVRQKVEYFLALARGGAVLVSPAISKGEQAVMRAGMNAGLPLLFLTPWGFNTFSKPGHQYYEACTEGRFLMMAPWEHQNERVPLTRSMCLALNQMAHEICCCAPEDVILSAQR
jgi:hypothetical protein